MPFSRKLSSQRNTPANAAPAPTLARAPVLEANRTEHIVATLTRAVVEHRLLPGSRLVEQRLGDHFGVSRTVVRQALFRLSELRLVRLEPGRGAFVAEPSPEEAREVFAVRRMLEGPMVRQLVEVLRPTHTACLRQHLAQERDALARGDVAERSRLLAHFHVLLAELLGNATLASLLRELVSRCALITLMVQSAPDAHASGEDHAEILKALEDRDGDRAAHLVDAHLQAIERQLTQRTPWPSTRLAVALPAGTPN